MILDREDKKRILVAEDEFLSQKLIEADLKSKGYTCTVVNNGEKAVEAMHLGEFDLVIMDISMPGMDGLEATKRIRIDGKNTPILALSAFPEDDYKQRSLDAGMNDFLNKPYQRDDLFGKIEKHLND
ncbi:MAG: response regulator [Bacteroidales bacterium]|jgi:CheY-like chemotaxis protein|nr:response regulator [Bacteroidales bacterium]MDD2323606.1 response regulator [Bacteroidales bacterium]MDD3962348.1 response regulator [Bacteroidales bacterium]MDY0285580.1 response regulator [Bacteroidales bacterium]HPE87616.1 response regulator [Bacteroidales bacterium]